MKKNFLAPMKEAPQGVNQTKEIKSLAEKKSEKAGELDSRYNELGKEFQLNKQEREDTFSLGKLQEEGFQTIINTFGVEATFQAIKQLSTAEQNGSAITTYELIRSLEPDAKKRKKLYKQMKVDAKQIQEKIKQSAIDSYETGESKSYSYSVSGSNFERIVSLNVSDFESLDGVLMKIMPNKFRKYMKGILAPNLQGFSMNVLQFPDKEKQLNEELGSADNNVEETLTNRNERCDQRDQEINQKAGVLISELEDKIKAKTDAANLSFEQWRTKIMADLKKVRGVEAESEEMSGVLKEALKRVESEIAERKKSIEKQLKQKVDRLINMKKVLESHF